MAKNIEVELNQISQAKWEKIKTEAEKQLGIFIVADSGIAEKSGYRVAWSYNSTEQKLVLTCTQWLPFTGTLVEKMLRGLGNV